ncbi:hypothetical protein LCGC14_2981170 [marine sediment metagenome]|uniref:Uncharacterized protein n=1 Tax=marine sediment metagenome TaxID=412755 RepID=A0A0F8ZE21_9ZZZZ
MSDVILGIDSTHLDRDLDAKKQEVNNASLAMLNAMREAAAAGVLILQVAGKAVDITFALYIEALIVGIQTLVLTARGNFGPKTILLGIQLVLMIRQIQLIKQKRQESSAQVGAAVQIVRMGLYRV